MGASVIPVDTTEKRLADIFIHQIGGDNNKMSVLRGLNSVQQALDSRLVKYTDAREVEYFMDRINEPTENFFELMDFWQTAEAYLDLLTEKEILEYRIFSLIYEMDGHYHWRKYLRLSSDMGGHFEMRIGELCESIDRICNSKVIKFLDPSLKVKYQMPLDRFVKEAGTFEYVFTRYHIAVTMKDGGVIVVVAGSEGLTPKRLHGYLLSGQDWDTYPTERLQQHRETLLQESEEQKLRGYGY